MPFCANDVLKLTDNILFLFRFSYFRDFQLVDIVNIEKVTDVHQGDRYLIEVILFSHLHSVTYRVSEFFFLKSKSPKLCVLDNLRWERNVFINVILNVKNQGAWILYFISEMSRILGETDDANVNFIIVDYGNDGVDIGQEMQR